MFKDEVSYRFARRQDLSGIVDIYNQAIANGQITGDRKPFTVEQKEEWFDRYSQNNYPFIVCELKGQIIGYGHISPYRPGRERLSGTGEITYYVDNAHFRKGVGGTLIDLLILEARDRNIQTLLAILVETNFASIQLLRKKGFKQWGELPHVFAFEDNLLNHLYFGLKL